MEEDKHVARVSPNATLTKDSGFSPASGNGWDLPVDPSQTHRILTWGKGEAGREGDHRT